MRAFFRLYSNSSNFLILSEYSILKWSDPKSVYSRICTLILVDYCLINLDESTFRRELSFK